MHGIADRFLAESRPIPTGHYAALDTLLDYSGSDTPFPFTLCLPQSRTEALLRRPRPRFGCQGSSSRLVGQQLARNTEGQVALATGFDPAHLALRAEMSELLTHPEVNRKLAGILSVLDLHYAPGPLLGGGERVADRALVLEDGRSTRLYDLLADGRWLHLSLGQPARKELPAWIALTNVRFETARTADGEETQTEASHFLGTPGRA